MHMKLRRIATWPGTLSPKIIKSTLLAALLACPLVAHAQLAATSWPEYRGGYGNTGTSTASGGFGVKRWSYATHGNGATVPVTGPDGNLYAGDMNGYIYQINRTTGAMNWSIQIPPPTTGSNQVFGIAIANNGMIYASAGFGVFAIKSPATSSGSPTITGSYKTNAGGFYYPPEIGPDGTVYVQTGNNFIAINPAAMTLKWQVFSSSGIKALGAVAADNSAVYVATVDGTIYALNPSTGANQWHLLLPEPSQSPVVLTPTMAIVEGRLGVYGVNLTTQSLAWNNNYGYQLNSGQIPMALSPDQSTLYISTDASATGSSATVTAIRVSTGASAWSYSVPGNTNPALVVGADGTIYLSSYLSGATVIALDPTGAMLWQCIEQAASGFGALSVGPDGAILGTTGASSNQIYSTWGSGLFTMQQTGSVTAGSTGTLKIQSAATLPNNVVFTLSAPDGSGITFPNGNQVTLQANTTQTPSFTFQTTWSSSASTVPITATCSFGKTSATMSVAANPLTVTALKPPSNMIGGAFGQAEVDISGPAPAGGTIVTVTSGNSGVIPSPGAVTIPAGQTKTTFTFGTNNVTAASTTVTLSARIGNTTPSTANVKVTPLYASNITLADPLVSGSSGTGTVTLNSAVATPTTVTLKMVSSSDSFLITFQSPVTVNAGSTSASFHYSVGNVAVKTGTSAEAICNGFALTVPFVIIPIEVSNISFSPTSVVGGTSTNCTVTINGNAPTEGFPLGITASPANILMMPTGLHIPVGSNTITFAVNTKGVGAPTQVKVTVADAGGGQSSTVTVTPPSVSSITFAYPEVIGSTGLSGTVTLQGVAPSGGIPVILKSSNSALILPAFATVPAGKSSVNFMATTTAVAANTQVNVTASLGASTQQTSVQVLPPAIAGLSMSPATLTPGSASTATVTISARAPAGGLTVKISSSSNDVTVPGSVVITAGATTATFKISAKSTAATGTATIAVAASGTSASATMIIQ